MDLLSEHVYLDSFVIFSLSIFLSLKAIRAKVWAKRSSSPLFNCQIYASDMERLFYRMWQRNGAGEKPDHITQWDDEEWTLLVLWHTWKYFGCAWEQPLYGSIFQYFFFCLHCFSLPFCKCLSPTNSLENNKWKKIIEWSCSCVWVVLKSPFIVYSLSISEYMVV